ncbi:glycosyltransferase family A protein [Brevundimonas nasdae]|uniref:glycosyltransferase family A protein n=1 Tax=Brevundimonas nasdae TaxID=172043 RepID=UPI0012EE6D0F
MADQTLKDAILLIIVVDDASRASPADDIAGHAVPRHVRLHLVRQSNGGPAAARNTG